MSQCEARSRVAASLEVIGNAHRNHFAIHRAGIVRLAYAIHIVKLGSNIHIVGNLVACAQADERTDFVGRGFICGGTAGSTGCEAGLGLEGNSPGFAENRETVCQWQYAQCNKIHPTCFQVACRRTPGIAGRIFGLAKINIATFNGQISVNAIALLQASLGHEHIRISTGWLASG